MMPQLVGIGRLMSAQRISGAAPPPPFVPTDLGAALLAWWSADRADLITLSGAQVTSWKDSVAAYDCVQAVAGSRPLYSLTSFNGAPGVSFDGVDDELTIASVPFPSAGNASEVWGLVDQTRTAGGDATARCIASYGGDTAAFQRRALRTVTSAQNRVAGQCGNGATTVVADLAADFSGRHVARVIFGTAAVTAAMDGTLGTPGAVVPNTGTSRFRIGALANVAATSIFWGAYRDLIITGALTVQQASNLNTYLYNLRMP